MSGRATIWRRRTAGPKSPIDEQHWYDYPAEIDKMVADAERFANYDVYYSPSVYSADKRVPENATEASVIWCDADTADPSVFRVQPSYVVQSSPGRWQTYWILDGTVPASRAALVARKIAYAHRDQGADVTSWPSNKLMRVPTTTNTNYDWPHTVSATDTSGAIYTIDELDEAYEDIKIEEKAPPRMDVTVSAPTGLPSFLDAQGKLPADFPLELITSEPPEGSRSEMRWKLIAELVEAGLTNEEVAAVAWEAKCSEKWSVDDKRGIDGLWSEIEKERARYEDLMANPPAEPKPRAEKKRKVNAPQQVDLLTDEERSRAKRHYKKTWLQEYEDWARLSLKIYNPRYNLAGGLMALSACLGDCARIVIDGRDAPLNLFMITLGETTTGKSLAKSLMRRVVKGSYPKEGNPDLGSNTSSQALLKIIHKRAGRSTMLTSDEADGFLNSLRDKTGWQADLMAKITDLYDGLAEPLNRVDNVDGEWTETSFGMYLMGTEVKVGGAIEKSMFESGFLARVIWFVGDRMDVPMSLRGARFSPKKIISDQNEQIIAWNRRFADAAQHWTFQRETLRHEPYIYPDCDETADWFQERTAQIESRFDNTDEGRMLTAAATRINISAAKIAALIAIADGRDSISKDDFMVALMIMERSMGDMIYMYRKVSASAHAKNLDLLETVIAQNSLGMHSSEVYKLMSLKGFTKRDVDSLAEELRQQRRITQKTGAGGFGHDWTVID